MADLKTNNQLSEEERMKQMAAQVRAAEYKGLSEEEIQERERHKEMRRKKNIGILEDTLGILTHMGSDGVMISPYVEVLKDGSSEALSEPFPISVMNCAAPMIRLGLEGMSQQEYEVMLSHRIQGMLLTTGRRTFRLWDNVT